MLRKKYLKSNYFKKTQMFSKLISNRYNFKSLKKLCKYTQCSLFFLVAFLIWFINIKILYKYDFHYTSIFFYHFLQYARTSDNLYLCLFYIFVSLLRINLLYFEWINWTWTWYWELCLSYSKTLFYRISSRQISTIYMILTISVPNLWKPWSKGQV